jgi:adenine-specific DNA glycosylase
MTGAIEFLRKAKAICNSKPTCHKCILSDYCGDIGNTDTDEADLVRKVMDYPLNQPSTGTD